jgi:hypothetical protein
LEIGGQKQENDHHLQPERAQLVGKSEQETAAKKGVGEIMQHRHDNQAQHGAGDHDRRFFEASWMHKYKNKYYFSYSTGDTHFICFATGDSPYGPFIYQGRILNPVVGWTTHHSICSFKGKWYLFYHDSSLSEGVTHLRSVKMTELSYDENGKIHLIDPYRENILS